MTVLAQTGVYVQQDWTDQALIADGFNSYKPVKTLTMVRMLPVEEAPKMIETSGETLTTQAGYWIAYVSGEVLKDTLDEYEPRPIEPDIFAQTYRPWDEPKEKLTATQKHLQELGCRAYYKVASVWAKHLTAETWIQSMESDKPVLAPAGVWLCIGTKGEPWSITEEWFQTHYVMRP